MNVMELLSVVVCYSMVGLFGVYIILDIAFGDIGRLFDMIGRLSKRIRKTIGQALQ